VLSDSLRQRYPVCRYPGFLWQGWSVSAEGAGSSLVCCHTNCIQRAARGADRPRLCFQRWKLITQRSPRPPHPRQPPASFPEHPCCRHQHHPYMEHQKTSISPLFLHFSLQGQSPISTGM